MVASRRSLLLAVDPDRTNLLQMKPCSSRYPTLRRRKKVEMTKRAVGGALRWIGRPVNIMGRMGCRRNPVNGVDGRVKTLQKLVPNGESMGFDELFRETADYIACLQFQVNVLQAMIGMSSDLNE